MDLDDLAVPRHTQRPTRIDIPERLDLEPRPITHHTGAAGAIDPDGVAAVLPTAVGGAHHLTPIPADPVHLHQRGPRTRSRRHPGRPDDTDHPRHGALGVADADLLLQVRTPRGIPPTRPRDPRTPIGRVQHPITITVPRGHQARLTGIAVRPTRIETSLGPHHQPTALSHPTDIDPERPRRPRTSHTTHVGQVRHRDRGPRPIHPQHRLRTRDPTHPRAVDPSRRGHLTNQHIAHHPRRHRLRHQRTTRQTDMPRHPRTGITGIQHPIQVPVATRHHHRHNIRRRTMPDPPQPIAVQEPRHRHRQPPTIGHPHHRPGILPRPTRRHRRPHQPVPVPDLHTHLPSTRSPRPLPTRNLRRDPTENPPNRRRIRRTHRLAEHRTPRKLTHHRTTTTRTHILSRNIRHPITIRVRVRAVQRDHGVARGPVLCDR